MTGPFYTRSSEKVRVVGTEYKDVYFRNEFEDQTIYARISGAQSAGTYWLPTGEWIGVVGTGVQAETLYTAPSGGSHTYYERADEDVTVAGDPVSAYKGTRINNREIFYEQTQYSGVTRSKLLSRSNSNGYLEISSNPTLYEWGGSVYPVGKEVTVTSAGQPVTACRVPSGHTELYTWNGRHVAPCNTSDDNAHITIGKMTIPGYSKGDRSLYLPQVNEVYVTDKLAIVHPAEITTKKITALTT